MISGVHLYKPNFLRH